MSRTKWAELEIAAACKKENPDWDGESFDYGCSCYQSALKAYKSLMNDNHSGYSFSITRSILEKLLHDIPLSPITDEDFFSVQRGTEEFPGESDEWLKEKGLKSDLQCPRRTSLFRREDLDGNVTYHDIDRVYCINAECPSDTYSSGVSNFIDRLHPITMPYMPKRNQFKVYVKSWLTDKKHGDFDVHVIVGYEDQEGNWHDYDLWKYYGDNGVEVITSPERKLELEKARLYPIEHNIASRLYGMIVDEFATDEIWKKDKKECRKIQALCGSVIEDVFSSLENECKCLTITNMHGICCKNTWGVLHTISGRDEKAKESLVREYPPVCDLMHLVDEIKKTITNKIRTSCE